MRHPAPPNPSSPLSARRAFVVLAIIGGLACLGCFGDSTPIPDLPPARAELPEPERLSGWRKAAIDGVLDGRVWLGDRSGYVALVARDGRLIHAKTTGYQDLESQIPMSMETRFQMASMTKPIVAVAAMILIEEGRIGLDDLVSKYLPEVGSMPVAVLDATGEAIGSTPQTAPMRIRHLLSFSSGIAGANFEKTPYVRRWRDEGLYAGEGSLADRVARLASFSLLEEPGAKWRYGASMDVMARIVEIVAGEPLEIFMKRRIFTPLDMHATHYLKDTPTGAPLATMYGQNESGDLVPDAVALYRAADWTPGGSGLVSTAPDYMRFALMLWNDGEYDGVRILERETAQLMHQLEVQSGVLEIMGIEGLGFGLGVSVVADADAATMPSRNGDYWWSGAYGTSFWVSPSTGTVLVVLQQNKMSENGGTPIAPFLVQQFALTD
ncbi:MAG: beta-lactamase family protein [bacterium]|nr:beta-lactamase family protein [bacterium]